MEPPLYQSYKDFATEVICADWEHSEHYTSHLDYVCDLNKKLPFQDQEFDTIILSDVLEHLLNPQDLWFEMFRILKSGGKVILNIPFLYKLHEIPYDYFRYTEYALKNFAEQSGFTIIVLEPVGGALETLTDLRAKIWVNFPVIGRFLAVLIQEVNAVFLRTNWGKRLTAKTRRHFPIGYFMIVQKP
jgi:ubiquinone/menaquinone biosynthesis C-methylase UbiE